MDLNEGLLGIGARIKHPTFGVGIVIGMDVSTLDVFFKHEGDKQISRTFEGLKVLDSPQQVEDTLDLKTVEDALKRVLKEMAGLGKPVDLAGRWDGGMLIMKPGNSELQSKEVPIDTFFHKIVMVRDLSFIHN